MLPVELLAEVEQHLSVWAAPGPDGAVFIGAKGGLLRPQVWQKEWARARRSVGLEQLHFHDHRHVAGTLAAATGAGTKELMHRLGHVSPQAALRYQHATRERDTAIANALDQVIRAGRPEPLAPVVGLVAGKKP